MKRIVWFFQGWMGAIFSFMIFSAYISAPAYCQTQNTALLLQQSPLQGGIITPRAGLYHLKADSEVLLTAVPRPGYRFLMWLGDVVDPTASNTTAYLDGPKVIIAVFERTSNDIYNPAANGSENGESQGSGFYSGGGLGEQQRMTSSRKWEENDDDLFFQRFARDDTEPQVQPDIDPIIPEPATGILLVLGGLALLGKSKRKQGCRSTAGYIIQSSRL